MIANQLILDHLGVFILDAFMHVAMSCLYFVTIVSWAVCYDMLFCRQYDMLLCSISSSDYIHFSLVPLA